MISPPKGAIRAPSMRFSGAATYIHHSGSYGISGADGVRGIVATKAEPIRWAAASVPSAL